MYEYGSVDDLDAAKVEYCEFLSCDESFSRGIERVFDEWPVSCEHFLTKHGMNRIAWLGQASVCVERGIPRSARGGFRMLSGRQQMAANAIADRAIQRWETERYAGCNYSTPGVISTSRRGVAEAIQMTFPTMFPRF